MGQGNKIHIGRRSMLKATGGLASVAALGTGQAVAAPSSSARTDHGGTNSYRECFDACRPITREERRLFIIVTDEDEEADANEDEETPVAQQILEQSGFDQLVTGFMKALCDTQSNNEAKELIEKQAVVQNGSHSVMVGLAISLSRS